MIEILNAPNLLDRFILQHCECSGEHWVGKGALYEAYKNFCRTDNEDPMAIHEFGKALKVKPFIQEGRNKRLRFWKGVRLLESHILEQKAADFPPVPDASVALPEEAQLPVEESKPVMPSTPKPKRSYLSDDAVNALILKNLFGIVETRQL